MKKCLYCSNNVELNKKFCSDKCRKNYHYHKNTVEKVCPVCSKTFIGTINKKYCSSSCKLKSVKKTLKTCPICNKRFKGRWDKKYCSNVCYRLSNDKTKGYVKEECYVCGRVYKKNIRSNTITCSPACGSKVVSLVSDSILKEMFNTTDEKIIRRKVRDVLEEKL